MNSIRVVLTNGTHRDFKTERVFTESDIRSLVTDILIFVKRHGEDKFLKIHSWFPVDENQKGDSTPV